MLVSFRPTNIAAYHSILRSNGFEGTRSWWRDCCCWWWNCVREVFQPDNQTAFLPAKWHRGVLLIPVSGREVGVVYGGEGQNDEKVSGTPRSVFVKHAVR